MKQKQRNRFNLSNIVTATGYLGGLRTLDVMLVLPGDTININMIGALALAPLHQRIILDAFVHIAAYFVPHRHVYGEDWKNFIKKGVQEDTTFTGISGIKDLTYLALYKNSLNLTIPKWRVTPYNQIWNYYYRDPSDDSRIKSDTDVPTDRQSERFTGWECGWLDAPWNSGITIKPGDNVDPDNESFNLAVDSGQASFSLRDLSRKKIEFKDQIDKKWFGRRYKEVMKRDFGTNVSDLTDQRPELLGVEEFWLGGKNIDGTDNETLGTSRGRTESAFNFKIPPKYFNEHGSVWFVSLVRMPPVCFGECNYLETQANPSYEEMAGDYDVVAAQKPIKVGLTNDRYHFFNENINSLNGVCQPYADWYRTQPNRIDDRFNLVSEGFPFIKPSKITDPKYHHLREIYDDIFQGRQLRHWNLRMVKQASAKRYFPKGISSIYTGT